MTAAGSRTTRTWVVLASSAISNAYYPRSYRGVGLVFENVAIASAGLMDSAILKEFVVLRKFTHNVNYPK